MNNTWNNVSNGYPKEKHEGLGYSKEVLVSDCKQVWTSNWDEKTKKWGNDEDDIVFWRDLPEPPHSQAETDIWDETIGV